MIIEEMIRTGSGELKDAGIDNFAGEAKDILMFITGYDASRLFMHGRDEAPRELENAYNKIIEKIKQGLTAIDLEGTGFKKESDPQNQWRLFILKKPLSELLVVDDFAEQKKTLKKNIIAGLNCILKCCKDL